MKTKQTAFETLFAEQATANADLRNMKSASGIRKDLEKICLDNHKVEHFFRIKNSLGYVALQKRILFLLTTDARERFEQFSAQYPKLIQRVPKKIIASYLGVSRETLSRITRKL